MELASAIGLREYIDGDEIMRAFIKGRTPFLAGAYCRCILC